MHAALEKQDTNGEEFDTSSQEASHDPRAVANYFIDKVISEKLPQTTNERVTPLALQKLVFIAHSLSLLDLKKALVSENPKVGRFDPYFPSLRESLAYFGGTMVSRLITEGTGEEVYEPKGSALIIESEFEDDEYEILDAVWELYQSVDYDCTRLTYLTGGTQYEFAKMSQDIGQGNDIPSKYIEKVISDRLLHPRNSGNHNKYGKCAA